MKLSTFKKWTKKFPELEYVMRRLANSDTPEQAVANAITTFNICDANSKWDPDFRVSEGIISYDHKRKLDIVTFDYREIFGDSTCFIIMRIVEHHVYDVWDKESWIEYEKIEIKIIKSS